MEQKVFSVYDLKACAFMQPFFSVNSGSAMRAFGDVLVKEPGSVMAMHPEDYQLFELGTYDDNSGSLGSIVPAKMLCSLSDFVQAKAPLRMAEGGN